MTFQTDLGTALADELRGAGASRVLTPEEEGFADALTGFNLAVVHRPDVVVVASSVEDVVAAVDVAARHDVPLQTLGRGHGTPWPIPGGIAVTTTGLAAVTVDPVERVARVGAGASWSSVLAEATPHGLAALCGSAPDVGVVGFLMGGGIGPLARTFGFAADHVRSVTIVTPADGLVRADASFNQELFWAVRGGKAGFGVVVEVEIDLFPLTEIYGGGLYFAASDVPAVARAFATWSRELPDAMTASFALLRLPPLEALPEPLRGQTVGHLRCGFVGEAALAEELLEPMRAVAAPVLDAVGSLPYAAIGAIHADPVDAMPVLDGGILLADLDERAVDRLLDVAGPAQQVPLVAVELRRLGGALSREADVPNAVGGRNAQYSLHVVGAPVPELFDQVLPAVIAGVFDAVDPQRRATTQVNFVGAANRAGDWQRAWTEDVRERLGEVRRRHDPRGILRLPQA
jgi:hypothetical protein